jgi:hypothetical protein
MSPPQLTVYVNAPTAVSGDQLNTFMQTCDNAAQMRAFIGVSGIGLFTRGMTSANDGSGGAFAWNATSTGPDDNLNVIVPSGAKIGAWVRTVLSDGNQQLVLTDFAGADPTGATHSDTAFINFVNAVLTTGLPGFIPPGNYTFAAAATIDYALTTTSRLGARFYGVQGRSILDFTGVAAFPSLQLTAQNVSHSCFYGEFVDISVHSNCAGPAVAIGTTDHAAAFNGFDFKMQIANANTSVDAIGLQVNGAFNSKIWVTANNGNHGDAIQITYMAFCKMFGAGGHCDIAQHLTDFFVFGNTFEALDLEVTNTCVVIDSASASRNTWLGGQFASSNGTGPQIANINATAGNSNRFIGCNFGAGPLTLNNTGIIIYGANPHGTETFGGVFITPPSGDGDIGLNSIAGNGSFLQLRVADVLMWEAGRNNAANTGGNVGSDFIILRCDDTGVPIDNPVAINRATGLVSLLHAALGTGSGGTVGFYGATAMTKQTVTGAKAGNTDLTLSILATLAALGIFTDGTT